MACSKAISMFDSTELIGASSTNCFISCMGEEIGDFTEVSTRNGFVSCTGEESGDFCGLGTGEGGVDVFDISGTGEEIGDLVGFSNSIGSEGTGDLVGTSTSLLERTVVTSSVGDERRSCGGWSTGNGFTSSNGEESEDEPIDSDRFSLCVGDKRGAATGKSKAGPSRICNSGDNRDEMSEWEIKLAISDGDMAISREVSECSNSLQSIGDSFPSVGDLISTRSMSWKTGDFSSTTSLSLKTGDFISADSMSWKTDDFISARSLSSKTGDLTGDFNSSRSLSSKTCEFGSSHRFSGGFISITGDFGGNTGSTSPLSGIGDCNSGIEDCEPKFPDETDKLSLNGDNLSQMFTSTSIGNCENSFSCSLSRRIGSNSSLGFSKNSSIFSGNTWTLFKSKAFGSSSS